MSPNSIPIIFSTIKIRISLAVTPSSTQALYPGKGVPFCLGLGFGGAGFFAAGEVALAQAREQRFKLFELVATP